LRNKKEWNELLQENKDAVVHYNIPLMKAAIIRDYMMLKVAHAMNIPIILHIHGGNYIKERNRPWYIKKLLDKIFSWSKHTIVLGDEEKQILEDDFKLKNVISMPNCIDLTDAKEFNRDITSKETLDILYLGRIEPNKGIDYIFDACCVLKEKGVKFHLHFAGKEEVEEQYIPKLKEKLGNCFTFHGIVSGDKKTDVLKKCDIFLLPSFYEGLPMSLLETMSFAQVPVVTPVGSIPTVVTDKGNGLFIEIKNSDSIVYAITELYKNRTLMQELSLNAQKCIFEKFDDDLYIKKLNKYYNKSTLL
jgi:glycosyltransferase involved in cell wall biosynthesis